ncbi:hypothetical protein I5V61_08335 [Stenotrophomonas maltophilia]|uniref:serine O-acetyltransferase n=2 Tax=Stenotrophomonas geniculata TaxID=86188 RepID=UPI0009EC8C72|nr:hypothetical protein [Stenotrophomonas maltophilia]
MRYIICDWAANRGNPKGRLILLSFRAVNLISRMPKAIRLPLLPVVAAYRVAVEWMLGVEIPWKTRIGPGASLYHGVGLVINDRAIIGRNVVLRHCTTIGVRVTSSSFDGIAPVIGDNVDIGSNATIIGPIKIGNNVSIGAGSVVITDVPDDCIAVGNPARIINRRTS